MNAGLNCGQGLDPHVSFDSGYGVDLDRPESAGDEMLRGLLVLNSSVNLLW